MRPALSVKSGWSDEDWDSTLGRHRESTFFHTRHWAKVVTQIFPSCVDRSAWFTGPAGDVLLPVFLWRRAGGLLSKAHSSFPFLYGGPVPLHLTGDTDPMQLSLEYLRTLRASIRITGNPFAVEFPSVSGASSGALSSRTASSVSASSVAASSGTASPRVAPPSSTEMRGHTHVLDLPSTEDLYWEGLSSGKRNDVRRLMKKGVEIEESANAADVDAAYGLYLASFTRWGGTPTFLHPPELYHALVNLGSSLVRFTVARFEGRVVGCAFVFRWNKRAHYFAGYFDHEARQLRPNVLIQIESIRAAIRSGFQEYDFLPSGGHAAVEEFKAGLGGEVRTFPIYDERRLLQRLIDRARRRNGSDG